MGEQLTGYRRTPEPGPRPVPGRLPTGRRLVVVMVGLAVLAVLAVAIVALSGDDEEAGGPSSTTSAPPVTGGRAPDAVVAGQLLPATLGPGWVEVSRDAQPVPAEVDSGDPCASLGQPIQRGLVVRAAFDHLGQTVLEQAALVAGVVEEGTTVPRLDDPAVVDCLQVGLRPQVAEGNEIVRVEQPLPATPDGAELTGARFEVHRPDDELAGRFDLLLLRRDRAVSFVLIAVQAPDQATPLDDLVAVLDGPLAAGAARLN